MLTPGDTTLVQGGSLAIDAYAMNYLGAGTAAASTTGFYLSSDSTVNTADLLPTTKSAPSLTDYNANGNGWFDHESFSVTLPGNVGPGTYYLGAYADYQA
jgi:hypothetical protein